MYIWCYISWFDATIVLSYVIVFFVACLSVCLSVCLPACYWTPFCSEHKKYTNLKFVILSANSNGNCAPDARFCRIKVIQGQDMLQFVVVYGRHQWKIFSVARCEITEFLKDKNWNNTVKNYFYNMISSFKFKMFIWSSRHYSVIFE